MPEAESSGEAFTLSGRGLFLLEAAVYRKHYWTVDGKNVSAYQKLLFDFLGIQAGAWTRGQAEAILRFGESRKDKKYAEYVLLGTLASFLCAIVIGVAAKCAPARLTGRCP